MSDSADPKIIRIDPAETNARREARQVAAQLQSIFRRPQTPVPQAELELLHSAARGDTGQSRTCRYLLFLLAGAKDPTGFTGQGLLEMRTLDQKLADAFLKILDWWRGPTQSDEPLYDVLKQLEEMFKE